MTMLNTFRCAATLAVCGLLAGCLVPEKFTASATVNPDASYLYKYRGTAVHAMAAMAIQSGRFSDKDEKALQQEAESERQKGAKNGVRKFGYLGKGRYEIQLEQTRTPGQSPDGLNLISVRQEKDGSYTLASPELKDKELRDLAKMSIKIDGKLEVALPPKVEVISHNATGTPGWFSKTYTWKIGKPEQRPTIRFKLPSKK